MAEYLCFLHDLSVIESSQLDLRYDRNNAGIVYK